MELSHHIVIMNVRKTQWQKFRQIANTNVQTTTMAKTRAIFSDSIPVCQW